MVLSRLRLRRRLFFCLTAAVQNSSWVAVRYSSETIKTLRFSALSSYFVLLGLMPLCFQLYHHRTLFARAPLDGVVPKFQLSYTVRLMPWRCLASANVLWSAFRRLLYGRPTLFGAASNTNIAIGKQDLATGMGNSGFNSTRSETIINYGEIIKQFLWNILMLWDILLSINLIWNFRVLREVVH